TTPWPRPEGGTVVPCIRLPAVPVARSEAVGCCQGALSGSGAPDPRSTEKPSCGIRVLHRVARGCLGPRQQRALTLGSRTAAGQALAGKASGHGLPSPERPAPAVRRSAGDLTCPNTKNRLAEASTRRFHRALDVRHGRAASSP